MRKNKGFALILVLWVLTLLAIMASSFALTIQRETAIISGLKENAEASASAEAGIYYAILMLLHDNSKIAWQANNSLYEINFSEKRIRIQIADESGKIDINQAEKSQLQRLFQLINIDDSIAESLSDAILDWRDKNDLHRINGAEKQQYAEADLKYAPRNAPFTSIEELQMVIGMTPEIFERIENMITIYSNSPKINPVVASREVLLTLADVNEEMVDSYIQQRINSERNSEAVTQPDWYQGNTNKINVYRIVAEVVIDYEITKQVMAIIQKGQAKNGLPFKILKWINDYHMTSLFLPVNNDRVLN